MAGLWAACFGGGQAQPKPCKGDSSKRVAWSGDSHRTISAQRVNSVPSMASEQAELAWLRALQAIDDSSIYTCLSVLDDLLLSGRVVWQNKKSLQIYGSVRGQDSAAVLCSLFPREDELNAVRAAIEGGGQWKGTVRVRQATGERQQAAPLEARAARARGTQARQPEAEPKPQAARRDETGLSRSPSTQPATPRPQQLSAEDVSLLPMRLASESLGEFMSDGQAQSLLAGTASVEGGQPPSFAHLPKHLAMLQAQEVKASGRESPQRTASGDDLAIPRASGLSVHSLLPSSMKLPSRVERAARMLQRTQSVTGPHGSGQQQQQPSTPKARRRNSVAEFGRPGRLQHSRSSLASANSATSLDSRDHINPDAPTLLSGLDGGNTDVVQPFLDTAAIDSPNAALWPNKTASFSRTGLLDSRAAALRNPPRASAPVGAVSIGGVLQDAMQTVAISLTSESAALTANAPMTGAPGPAVRDGSFTSARSFADSEEQAPQGQGAQQQQEQQQASRAGQAGPGQLREGVGATEEDLDAEEEEAEAEEEGPDVFHEVLLKRVEDPVTGEPRLLLRQRDVSAWVVAELQLSDLIGAQIDMLAALYPRHVLEHLSSMGTTGFSRVNDDSTAVGHLARRHTNISILFMDIVGFTTLSKEADPSLVMGMLDRLFSAFDRLVDYHKVHKVETAGDCYIVSSGVMEMDEDGFMSVLESHDQSASAARLLAFAKSMLKVSRTVRKPDGSPLVVRIGIHTGNAVSGLSGGWKLPKYSLFGDTMNTASRMESTAPYGRIQISDATWEFLLDAESVDEKWEAMGTIEVKGKGKMATFCWVESPGWQALLDPAMADDEAGSEEGEEAGGEVQVQSLTHPQGQAAGGEGPGASGAARPPLLRAQSARLSQPSILSPGGIWQQLQGASLRTSSRPSQLVAALDADAGSGAAELLRKDAPNSLTIGAATPGHLVRVLRSKTADMDAGVSAAPPIPSLGLLQAIRESQACVPSGEPGTGGRASKAPPTRQMQPGSLGALLFSELSLSWGLATQSGHHAEDAAPGLPASTSFGRTGQPSSTAPKSRRDSGSIIASPFPKLTSSPSWAAAAGAAHAQHPTNTSLSGSHAIGGAAPSTMHAGSGGGSSRNGGGFGPGTTAAALALASAAAGVAGAGSGAPPPQPAPAARQRRPVRRQMSAMVLAARALHTDLGARQHALGLGLDGASELYQHPPSKPGSVMHSPLPVGPERAWELTPGKAPGSTLRGPHALPTIPSGQGQAVLRPQGPAGTRPQRP